MIQPLRVAHRIVFVGLAVLLPAILLIGLGARGWRPGQKAHIADVPATAYVVRESSNLWQKHVVQSRFYGRPDRPQEIDVVLQSTQDLNSPDLLLYWGTSPPQGNVLPPETKLVGPFKRGEAFPIPLNEERAGYLILFSPAQQSVFDTARVEKLP